MDFNLTNGIKDLYIYINNKLSSDSIKSKEIASIEMPVILKGLKDSFNLVFSDNTKLIESEKEESEKYEELLRKLESVIRNHIKVFVT